MKTIEEIEISSKTSFIILGLIVLIGASFWGFSKYTDYKTQSDNKERELLALIADQKKAIDKVQDDFGSYKTENESQVDALRRKLSSEETVRKALEEKRENESVASQQKIDGLEKKLSDTSILNDLSTVIKSWEPIVVYIECDFDLSGAPVPYSSNGSGVLVKFSDSPVKVITNRHLFSADNSLYDVRSCAIKLPESNEQFVIPVDDIEVSSAGYDWGTLTINSPNQTLLNLTVNLPYFCEQNPSLGDEVVVLGYPGIGSKNGVTATEGIISGFDGDYFITSAKVEQGNSGGAAILQKENCLLGIPTYASLGQVESLARILNIWTVVTK